MSFVRSLSNYIYMEYFMENFVILDICRRNLLFFFCNMAGSDKYVLPKKKLIYSKPRK